MSSVFVNESASTYVQALSCPTGTPATLQNELQRLTLQYPNGQIIKRSPFFQIAIPPKAIFPLQNLSGLAKLDSQASSGVLSWVELTNASNPVFTKPIFVAQQFKVSLSTAKPSTIVYRQISNTGAYQGYFVLFVQDPNVCTRATNSFTVPDTKTYINAPSLDPLATNEIVFTSVTDTKTIVTVPLRENINALVKNATTESTEYDSGLFILDFFGTDPLLTAGEWSVDLKVTFNLLSKQDIQLFTIVCQEIEALTQ